MQMLTEWWNSLTIFQQVFGPILLVVASVVSQMILTQDKRQARRIHKDETCARCKGCGRLVSWRKITGSLCAYCYVDSKPDGVGDESGHEVKRAIPAEVRDDG